MRFIEKMHKQLYMSKKNCNFAAFYVLLLILSIMKKRNIIWGMLAMVLIAVTSCSKEEPTFQEADLLGLWQKTGTEEFVRFTNEKDNTGEYKYGCEWNEGEDVFEEYLTKYGNGWFKYKLVKSDLTEIHLMDNGGAYIPKVYTVLTLTEDALKYKDEQGTTTTYEKVVTK